MKSLVLKILSHPLWCEAVLKLVMKVHSKTYHLMGTLGSIYCNGNHPKHDIVNYEGWFLDNIKESDSVIDIGSNRGKMAYKMSTKANSVYGIEIVDKHHHYAQANYRKENLGYICGDATTYDYRDMKSISVLTLSNVLEHIEHRPDFLKNIVSNMKWNPEKPKKMLIRVPMIDREWTVYFKQKLGVEHRLDTTHFTEYTERSFRGEMSEANIEIESLSIRFGEIYSVCYAR